MPASHSCFRRASHPFFACCKDTPIIVRFCWEIVTLACAVLRFASVDFVLEVEAVASNRREFGILQAACSRRWLFSNLVFDELTRLQVAGNLHTPFAELQSRKFVFKSRSRVRFEKSMSNPLT